MAFQNPDTSYENETGTPPVTLARPASGDTVVVRAHTRKLFVNPAANLASLTIQLPRNPEKFYELDIGYGASVAALNFIDGAGAAVPNMPTSGTAGANQILRCLSGFPGQASPWVRWRG